MLRQRLSFIQLLLGSDDVSGALDEAATANQVKNGDAEPEVVISALLEEYEAGAVLPALGRHEQGRLAFFIQRLDHVVLAKLEQRVEFDHVTLSGRIVVRGFGLRQLIQK